MATIEPNVLADGKTKRYRVRYRTPDKRSTDKDGFARVKDAKDFAATVEVSMIRASAWRRLTHARRSANSGLGGSAGRHISSRLPCVRWRSPGECTLRRGGRRWPSATSGTPTCSSGCPT